MKTKKTFPLDRKTLEIHRNNAISEEKLLHATRESLEAFFHDYDYIHKIQKGSGEVVVYVRKKMKCVNCVMYIPTKIDRVGICGDPDRNRSLRLENPNLIIEATVGADDLHQWCFKRRRRTIGGQPVDERVSCLLEGGFCK